MTTRVRILNGQFDPLTLPQTVDAVFERVRAGQRGWLCTVNVAILMMMRDDQRLQQFVDRSALIVADGQPLIWCARWFGQYLPERVTGVDLVEALCDRAAREGKRVFLLGATQDVVGETAARLRSRFAGLQVAFDDGYFSNEEAPRRADQIRNYGAEILIVGMGVPRQEHFIEDQWDRLGVAVAMGVGGSFDVMAGLRARAPVWMQKISMEWLFRLIQEPRRLFKRYLVTNCQMIWLVCCALLKRNKTSV
jgi:N-acetylglucosaminyldiphosphoundecaprenol N-acetyl-beta-D-mannosaminyltransferase